MPPSRTAAAGGGFGQRLRRRRFRRHLRGHLRRHDGRRPRRRASGGRERGADLRYNLEITLEEAFAGKTAQIRVPTSIACEACSGIGRQARHAADDLPDLRRPRHGARRAGLLLDRAHLPDLPGPRRDRSTTPARTAPARAASPSERTLSVNIPAGVEDGTRIRLAGEGEAGLRGGPSGDLYIFLSIKPHEFFQRDGADLYCRVPISMTTAALGGEFEVPTLDGTQTRGEGAGGHPDRQAVPPQGQGHAGAALAQTSATSTSRSRSRRRRT